MAEMENMNNIGPTPYWNIHNSTSPFPPLTLDLPPPSNYNIGRTVMTLTVEYLHVVNYTSIPLCVCV